MDVRWSKAHVELIAETILNAIKKNPDDVILEKKYYDSASNVIKYKDIWISFWNTSGYYIVVNKTHGTYERWLPGLFYSECRKMRKALRILRKREHKQMLLRLAEEDRIMKEKADSAILNNLPDMIDEVLLKPEE